MPGLYDLDWIAISAATFVASALGAVVASGSWR